MPRARCPPSAIYLTVRPFIQLHRFLLRFVSVHESLPRAETIRRRGAPALYRMASSSGRIGSDGRARPGEQTGVVHGTRRLGLQGLSGPTSDSAGGQRVTDRSAPIRKNDAMGEDGRRPRPLCHQDDGRWMTPEVLAVGGEVTGIATVDTGRVHVTPGAQFVASTTVTTPI